MPLSRRVAALLRAAMDRLLESQLTDPDNRKLAERLKKHRAALFRFLYEEAVEAINNRSERALRPAVIYRKIYFRIPYARASRS